VDSDVARVAVTQVDRFQDVTFNDGNLGRIHARLKAASRFIVF